VVKAKDKQQKREGVEREKRRGTDDDHKIHQSKSFLIFLALLSTFRDLGLLREKFRVNVGEDSSLRNDYTSEKTVQLFIVTNGELQVTGDDTRLLVVTIIIERREERGQLSIRWERVKTGRLTERRYQPIREFQQRGTRGQQRGRRGHQL